MRQFENQTAFLQAQTSPTLVINRQTICSVWPNIKNIVEFCCRSLRVLNQLLPFPAGWFNVDAAFLNPGRKGLIIMTKRQSDAGLIIAEPAEEKRRKTFKDGRIMIAYHQKALQSRERPILLRAVPTVAAGQNLFFPLFPETFLHAKDKDGLAKQRRAGHPSLFHNLYVVC